MDDFLGVCSSNLAGLIYSSIDDWENRNHNQHKVDVQYLCVSYPTRVGAEKYV